VLKILFIEILYRFKTYP